MHASELLRRNDAIQSVGTWVRTRTHYHQKIQETLFTSLENSPEQTEFILRALQSRFVALFCCTETPPIVKQAENEPPGIVTAEYFTQYRTLLPFRLHISCLLKYWKESDIVDVANRTSVGSYAGSLDISHVDYNPPSELSIVRNRGKSIFKSQGTERAKGFEEHCLTDPALLYVPQFSSESPYRTLRRNIRHEIHHMLADSFLKDQIVKLT